MTDKPDLPVTERESPETLADLDPKKVSPAEAETVKGGSSAMANAHEMKKALIGNIPR